MGELMKGDQIRGWGLCFRSGAQIQVSGSGLKHDFMIRVTSQIDSCQARADSEWGGEEAGGGGGEGRRSDDSKPRGDIQMDICCLI